MYFEYKLKRCLVEAQHGRILLLPSQGDESTALLMVSGHRHSWTSATLRTQLSRYLSLITLLKSRSKHNFLLNLGATP